MKKIKTIFVSLLAMLMVMVCFTSCFKTGKYEATALKVCSTTTELEDNASFVELKMDNTAVVSINVKMNLLITTIDETIAGEGTWKDGEDEGTIVITIDDTNYTATIDGNTMILKFLVFDLILEK